MVTHAFTPSNICPICNGYASLPAKTGRRCFGFMGSDGKYAHCTREELAFNLDLESNGTYAHKLSGKCKCGAKHGLQETVAGPIEYQILDAGGKLVAIHKRIDKPDGSKNMPWLSSDGTAKLGVPVATLPLYGVHELAALPDGAKVVVTEGEKARDALASDGVQAVGTVTGAASLPNDAALEPLLRLEVILWPDNDEQGRKHMQRLGDRLAALGPAPRVIEWRDAPTRGDAADFMEGINALQELIDAAPICNVVTDVTFSKRATRRADELTSPIVTLKSVYDFLGRFVAYPNDSSHVAHTLWLAHTHLMDAWISTPRIAFLSPEAASGKTRALEVTELLVPRAVEAVNVTPAYLFRKVGDAAGRPTILYDEIDTIFGPRAKDNEEIRGLLNAGHRQGAVAGRCVVKGKIVTTEDFPAYCAVALAGIGTLPDTLLSRCIIVKMRRRAPGETVEPFRRRDELETGTRLHDDLHAWADSVEGTARDFKPELPESIQDRNADIWEALLAVAELVGGEWPERARASAVAMVAESKVETVSLGVRLLEDLRTIFKDATALPTENIISKLVQLKEAPWGDLHGKPITSRFISLRLRGYGVQSKSVREGPRVARGYKRDDLTDAWERYCTTLHNVGESRERGVTSVTPLHFFDAILIGDEYKVIRKKLYDTYLLWADNHNETPISATEFRVEVQAYFPQARRVRNNNNGVLSWRGIGLSVVH